MTMSTPSATAVASNPNLLADFQGRRPEAPTWFTDALSRAPERELVAVRGANIEMLSWGVRGAPGLLLLHGLGAHADWWSHIAPFLAAKYRVSALSWSGMGGSDWRANYSLDAYLEETLVVMRSGGLLEAEERPLAVGHSFGGLMLLAAAARFGDRLKGAVVVDSYLQPDGEWYLPAPGPSPTPSPERPPESLAPRPMPVYSSREAALARFRFAPPQACDNLFIADHIARLSLKPVTPAGQREGGWTWRFDPRMAYQRPRVSVSSCLAGSLCPLAFIAGGRSPLTNATVQNFVRTTARPRTPWIEIPASDHHVLVDQPLALVSALSALFQRWPAPADLIVV